MMRLIVCALATALIGCGGGSSSGGNGNVEEDTSGGEVVDNSGGTGGEQPPPEEEPARGPGQLRVTLQVGSAEAAGRVRVLDESGEVAAEGNAGETFTVQSGTYTIAGEITDADVLADTPSREGDAPVTVMAGQESSASVVFPVSRIRIRVTRRGRPVARWTMQVRPQSDSDAEPIELRPSQEHTAITPGRYSAVLRLGSEEITVNEIIFQGGATMDVPVNLD
jgi:hypothetical protein